MESESKMEDEQKEAVPVPHIRFSMPEVPEDGILVKTICAGLGRQVGYNKDEGERRTKLYSNELCGRVLSLGSKVSSNCTVKPGDVVVVYPWQGCGQCEICSAGSTFLCEDDMPNGSEDLGGTAESSDSRNFYALSNFLVVPDWQNVVKLPREIPKDIGCLLPYWALKVYAAIVEAKPSFEQAVLIRGFGNLLVIGCGNLELWCIAFLKNVFCDRNVKVVVAERRQESLNLASKCGADDAVLWKAGASVRDMVEATTMSGYNKMDVVLDLVGDATSFAVAFLSLHNGGTVLELQGNAGQRVDLPLSLLLAKSITVKAVKAGTRHQLKQLMDLIAIQRVELSIPVETFASENVVKALDKLDNDEAEGHVLIRYNE